MSRAGDMMPPASAFEGRSFGAYRLGRVIGTGGMATVFMARRTGPGRFAQTAALKVIHPHLAQEREFVEMFLEEARIASSINHPNVCRVLDFGQAEGTYYLAMEYVRGETWASTLEKLASQRESRLRIHAIANHVIGQACEGLHAVHEAVDSSGAPLQIVHRDISPQNLFVAYDGSVRILDFGIALSKGARAQGSSTSRLVKGRNAYMAPEQALGAEVDRRADIWSLGVCLREALAGERLFERETQMATLRAVTQEPLPPWPKHVPLLLREICDRALERDPAARFPTAREFGSALARFASSEAEPSGNAELGRRMRSLFPEQIAHKRSELRELAGDDTTTGTFTSIVPRLGTATARETPARGRRRSKVRRYLRWSIAGALSLGASFLAFRLTSRVVPGHSAVPDPAPLVVRTEVHEHTPEGAATGAAAGSQPLAPLAPGPSSPAHGASPGNGSARTELSPEMRALQEAQQAASSPRPAPPVPATERPSDETGAESGHRGHHRRPREPGAPAPASAASAPAPAPAPAGAPGVLIVGAASGWAQVSLAGRELGTTPFRVELPAGNHRLDVRFFGTGSAQPVNVEVKPGATTKLRLTQ
jgi:serine/threonine-protein kinase